MRSKKKGPYLKTEDRAHKGIYGAVKPDGHSRWNVYVPNSPEDVLTGPERKYVGSYEDEEVAVQVRKLVIGLRRNEKPWEPHIKDLEEFATHSVELRKALDSLKDTHRRPETVATVTPIKQEPSMQEFSCDATATDYLRRAIHTLSQRAKEYDSPDGEKSIGKTVQIFNSLTGSDLSEADGWLFMVCLKLVRSRQGDFKEDTFVDLAAYSALCGEAQSSDDEYDPEMLGVNT
jgi:hypothetical protein